MSVRADWSKNARFVCGIVGCCSTTFDTPKVMKTIRATLRLVYLKPMLGIRERIMIG